MKDGTQLPAWIVLQQQPLFCSVALQPGPLQRTRTGGIVIQLPMARRPWERRKPPKGRFPRSGPTSDPPFRRTDLPQAVGPSGGFQPAGLLHTTLVDQPHGFCRGAFLSSICFALHSCPASARSCSQFVIHCISSAAGEAPPPRLQPRRGPPAAGGFLFEFI